LPERSIARQTSIARSDLVALGCILLHALRCRAFTFDDSPEVRRRRDVFPKIAAWLVRYNWEKENWVRIEDVKATD